MHVNFGESQHSRRKWSACGIHKAINLNYSVSVFLIVLCLMRSIFLNVENIAFRITNVILRQLAQCLAVFVNEVTAHVYSYHLRVDNNGVAQNIPKLFEYLPVLTRFIYR